MKVTSAQEARKELVCKMHYEEGMSCMIISEELDIKYITVVNIVNSRQFLKTLKPNQLTSLYFGNKTVEQGIDEMEYGTPKFKCTWDDLSKVEKALYKK